jgi:hypothetical protein
MRATAAGQDVLTAIIESKNRICRGLHGIHNREDMHRRTFECAMGRIDRAEDTVEGHAVFLLNRVASR